MTILQYEDCLIQTCREYVRCIKETIKDETIYAFALILTEGGTQAFGYFNTLERYKKDLEDSVSGDVYVTGHLWSAARVEFSPFDDWMDLHEGFRSGKVQVSEEQVDEFYALFEEGHEFNQIVENVMLTIRDEVYAEPRGCFVEDVFISLQDFSDDVNMLDSMITSKLINSKAGHELTKRYWSGYVTFQEFMKKHRHLA